jgi:hypothetical protein
MELKDDPRRLNNKLTDICYKLLENQNLCKLIGLDGDDPLSEPDLDSPQSLFYDRILPYYTNPSTIGESRTSLSVYFDYIKGKSNNFNNMTLTFMILTHESLKKIDGGSRVNDILYFLLDDIDKLRDIGLGKLEMDYAKLYVPNEEYSGYIISFKIDDFKNKIGNNI